ncbi:MAG: protease modulator HflC, partial [Proteobacteria bacterium]|nr:protease modulator HflC [Pseudomonadota bacterium]
MMGTKIIIAVILLALIASVSLFKVQQWEQAIVFKFREIERSDYKPGLHFKIPGVNTSQTFEKRLLNLDQEPQRFLTKEKKDVIVDYYVKWRISDVGKFYTISLGGDVQYANALLEQRITRALRDEFGKKTVQEVVAGDRGEIFDALAATIADLPQELGILVVDIRTKRIDLPAEVSHSVYERMRAERLRVAKDFRARGEEAAERISATADREREIILANAYRDAEIIRGEGDAQATETYAAAFGRDEEFYAFYRSLSAYQNSFSGQNDILLISPESDFFKYFNHPLG